MPDATSDRVSRAETCSLTAGRARWPFAEAEAAAIDAHWARRSAENPGFFNGVIHLLRHHTFENGVFKGELVRTDFKSYLYWREMGFPDASVRDAFGSALIRSAEGHVLLGRQREGNINSGLTYLPGGFIDARDVGVDGSIDIAASVLREVEEETGLPAGGLIRRPGFHVTVTSPLISIAVELVSIAPAEVLRTAMLAHMAADPESELTDAVIVRSSADLSGLAMPDYARILLLHLFSGG